VLHSDEEGRTILINLPAGEALQAHQVHERAWMFIVDGRVEIDDSDGGSFEAGPGGLALTAPNERHEVRAVVRAAGRLPLSRREDDGLTDAARARATCSHAARARATARARVRSSRSTWVRAAATSRGDDAPPRAR